jgi:hypothetical protein
LLVAAMVVGPLVEGLFHNEGIGLFSAEV